MRESSSPLLHRDSAPTYVYHEDAEQARQQEYRERARITLERLWYKRYGLTVFPRVMQRLGDWGRKYVLPRGFWW